MEPSWRNQLAERIVSRNRSCAETPRSGSAARLIGKQPACRKVRLTAKRREKLCHHNSYRTDARFRRPASSHRPAPQRGTRPCDRRIADRGLLHADTKPDAWRLALELRQASELPGVRMCGATECLCANTPVYWTRIGHAVALFQDM